MERKKRGIPFDIELAKKITNGEVKGRIVTRDGRSVRIVCFDARCEDNIIALVTTGDEEYTRQYPNDGHLLHNGTTEADLFIEMDAIANEQNCNNFNRSEIGMSAEVAQYINLKFNK